MLHAPRALQGTALVTRARCSHINTVLVCQHSLHLQRMSNQAVNSSVTAQVQQDQQPPAAEDPIVQWVVLRRDLWTDIGWPLGPVIAQACHASSAAMFTHMDDPLTQQYVAQDNIDHMHKVVLEVKSEQQLVNLSNKLEQEGILHKLWIEQPENYPTCLATKPYRKSQAAAFFKKLQLCKAALAR